MWFYHNYLEILFFPCAFVGLRSYWNRSYFSQRCNFIIVVWSFNLSGLICCISSSTIIIFFDSVFWCAYRRKFAWFIQKNIDFIRILLVVNETKFIMYLFVFSGKIWISSFPCIYCCLVTGLFFIEVISSFILCAVRFRFISAASFIAISEASSVVSVPVILICASNFELDFFVIMWLSPSFFPYLLPGTFAEDKKHDLESSKFSSFPANVYLFHVKNRNTRKRCEICSKFTIKTPELCHWLRSGVFIVNFEHISHLFLLFLLLTLKR